MIKQLYQDWIKGIWRNNPVFVQLLGMCPTLAVTTSLINGIAMGCATCFVLVASSLMVSVIRRLIPGEVRIAGFTIIIATFVTVAELFLAANFPLLSKTLGPYVPLIIVNCIILGRAEAFASKHSPIRALADSFGMGVGFTLSLVLLGSIRELFATGGIIGTRILPASFENWVVMIMPAGAFLTLGFLIGLFNMIESKLKSHKVTMSQGHMTQVKNS
ncbi:MAG: electron transport complex subunit E [Candidatus Omnitrophica bacterium]|nr:electron transport complex subunit E [Candidatus Omnitrophota bacterium]